MTLRRVTNKRQAPEPTITLINVVFLMLVFFLIAGTIAPPLEGDLKLVLTKELEGRAPPDALVLHSDGHVSYRGNVVDPENFDVSELTLDGKEPLRLVPDRDLAAQDLLQVAAKLQASGAQEIVLITERGLE